MLSHGTYVPSNLLENARLFSKVVVPICSPTSICERSCYSTSSLTFDIIGLGDFCQSSGYKMLSLVIYFAFSWMLFPEYHLIYLHVFHLYPFVKFLFMCIPYFKKLIASLLYDLSHITYHPFYILVYNPLTIIYVVYILSQFVHCFYFYPVVFIDEQILHFVAISFMVQIFLCLKKFLPTLKSERSSMLFYKYFIVFAFFILIFKSSRIHFPYIL